MSLRFWKALSVGCLLAQFTVACGPPEVIPLPDAGPKQDAGVTDAGVGDLGARATPAEDALVARLAAIHTEVGASQPSPETVRQQYVGTDLQVFVAANDSDLGRADDLVIVELLRGADALDLISVENQVLWSASLALRERLKGISDKYPDPTTPTAELLLEWDRGYALYQAFRPAVVASDEASGDTAAAELEAAFLSGNEGIHENDAIKVGGSRQVIEKTLFRAIHGRTVQLATTARTLGSPDESHFRAQRVSLGWLQLLTDRMKGRNSQGLVLAERMLTRKPQEIDPASLEAALNLNWAKRTYSYVAHAVGENANRLGTPGAVISAMEGKTYYKLIAPDVVRKLPGTDTAATLVTWDAWIAAIDSADAAAAQRASDILENQVCAYQQAIGIATCTSSGDVPAAQLRLRASPATVGITLDEDAALNAVSTFLAAVDVDSAAAAYAGALETFVEAIDARYATSTDLYLTERIAAGNGEVELDEAKWRLRWLMTDLFRRQSTAEVVSLVGGTTPKATQLAGLDKTFRYFWHGWRDIAELADTNGDTILEDTLTGFDRMDVGVQDQDEREAGAGRQMVEKSIYRAFFHRMVQLATDAKLNDDVTAQRAAAAILPIFRDRLDGKITSGQLADLELQLDSSSTHPTDLDLSIVRDLPLIAFSKRTFRYTHHVSDPSQYGEPAPYIGAVEGHTYFKLLAPDFATRVTGADLPLVHKLWSRWIDSIESGFVARAEATSDYLEGTSGVCGFQQALGLTNCTE